MKTTAAADRCIYAGDGIPDHRGNDRCTDCGLPKAHDRHQLPAQPAEADERDAAILGEHREN